MTWLDRAGGWARGEGIGEDYYVAVPPDPTDDGMERVWAMLLGLTRQT